jgi:hypothetical protein
MGTVNDPFEALTFECNGDFFEDLTRRPVGKRPEVAVSVAAAVVTARLHGFAIDDSPVLAALPQLPGELVDARTAVPLRREEIGATVIVVFDGGEVRRPIVLGVLQDTIARRSVATEDARRVTVQVDDQRHEIVAEREIVLRCGEASITLTRAGKVLIKGNYILSRSSGYNKIKGAAVDIN